ncbi:hypothetical protein MASR1M59_25170 [Melaminivora sp.]
MTAVKTLLLEGAGDALGFVAGALAGYGAGRLLGLELFAPGYGLASLVAIALVGLGGGLGLQLARRYLRPRPVQPPE